MRPIFLKIKEWIKSLKMKLMDGTAKNCLIAAGVVVVILVIIGFAWWQNQQPGKFDNFAKCLSDKGVKFYGAFWCPHCQNQKSLFGNSQKYLPYVECSTDDSNGQLKVCEDAKINAYPTWKFPDGSSKEGELTIDELAKKSSCKLP